MNTLRIIIQVCCAIAIAPLVSGFIRKVKNSLRMRLGAPILQPYYNLGKYFSKQEIVSEHASYIFLITPYIVFASTIAALTLIPVFHFPVSGAGMGDAITLFFLLALGRFFLALAGLDCGSAFGGMGSSREMFISSLVEPIAITALSVVAWQAGAYSLSGIQGQSSTSLSSIIAVASLTMVTIAETARIPVDNQETHLELTMVHEAMVLEYSGRSLALLELAMHIKQFIFFSLLACMVWPMPLNMDSTFTEQLIAAVFFMGKISCFAIMFSFLEIALAKMRLFRVVDFLGFGMALSLLALAVHLAGV